ncbi:hypothetical protein [Lentzea sp. NBRC 102530]|nr:hypothetical protein [Lentzea sp. NBRC 102530]
MTAEDLRHYLQECRDSVAGYDLVLSMASAPITGPGACRNT